MIDCYIFDIDGTIADLSHRLHHIQKDPKDWDAFFAACPNDKEISHVCALLDLIVDAGRYIVFVSGRSDQCRQATEDWLEDRFGFGQPLYMRKAGDHRPDNLVKAELLEQLIADGYRPLMAFDDRDQVVKMWRERGIPCAQVAEGNF